MKSYQKGVPSFHVSVSDLYIMYEIKLPQKGKQ